MAFIKGQPAYFFFEVRDLETGAISEGCTFQSQTAFKDGTASTLSFTLTEDAGLWKVSIPALPSDCETLTFRFVPASGLNVHVPLVTISLENAPAESVSYSLIAKNVWDYPVSSITNTADGFGWLLRYTVGSITDPPTPDEIASAVWSKSAVWYNNTTYMGTWSYDDWLRKMYLNVQNCAAGADLASISENIIEACRTPSGFATTEEVASAANLLLSQLATSGALESAKDEILAQCATATGFATPDDVQLETASVNDTIVDQCSNMIVECKAALADSATQKEIKALLGSWSVSGNVLTTYDTSGNTLSVYSLTRDADGNITRVSH